MASTSTHDAETAFVDIEAVEIQSPRSRTEDSDPRTIPLNSCRATRWSCKRGCYHFVVREVRLCVPIVALCCLIFAVAHAFNDKWYVDEHVHAPSLQNFVSFHVGRQGPVWPEHVKRHAGIKEDVMEIQRSKPLPPSLRDADTKFNNVISGAVEGGDTGFAQVMAMQDEAKIVEMKGAINVARVVKEMEVSKLDEYLIEWGFKEDPRVPEECRIDPITKIKELGTAGFVSYALIEGGFWLVATPLAMAAVTLTTGSLPDITTVEGKEATAGYLFMLFNLGNLMVPLQIALAVTISPWVDKNIIQKVFPPTRDLPDECIVNGEEEEFLQQPN